MASSIFSTYSTGENRVTSSIMAVLKSLSISRIERLLGALLEQSEFELVRFQNQPAKGAASVPDAEILGSCRILIETKIIRNSVRAKQLEGHLQQLNNSNETTKLLLVITPDQSQPKVFNQIKDEHNQLTWASFDTLDQAIDELLTDVKEVISEREAFLLRELQVMLEAEGLVGAESQVVVVAARYAWPEYQNCNAYICQPGRSFQPVNRIAFYSKNQVYPLVPSILGIQDNVAFERGRHKGELGKVVDQLINNTSQSNKKVGQSYKVFILSSPEDPNTLQLEQPIINDMKSKTGKPTAFTMGQRYITVDKLEKAKKTSDLV